MENLDSVKSISSVFKRTALIAGLLFCGAAANAQSNEISFKVAPPAEAKELVKDSIDNFLSFSPVYVEGKTYLRWLVQNDKKDGVFIVERSEDGDQYEALGFKDRVGSEKNVNLFYSYVDDAPPAGYAHYRIMQVGVDHTFNYSDAVRVKTSAAANSTGSASAPVSEESDK